MMNMTYVIMQYKPYIVEQSCTLEYQLGNDTFVCVEKQLMPMSSTTY